MDASESLAREVLASRARRHPAWATQVGLPGHDHELRRSTRDAHEEEASELDALLDRAAGLAPSLDRDALVTQLSLEVFDLRESRGWARNPDVATEFFDHLFALLVAAHLSIEARAAALAARLGGAAAFFEGAWPRFEPAEVPPLWVDGAKQSVDAGPAFIEAVREAARGTASEAQVEAGLVQLRGLIEAHARWLGALHGTARGSVALGTDRFEALLRLRHIDDSPAGLLALGERTVERFRGDMLEAALTVLAEGGKPPATGTPASMIAEALEVVRADHPRTFAGVLDAYRVSIVEAREFVRDRGLAPVPDVPLDVVETPSFLRHLVPFAAYVGPARFASPARGVYLVTPKTDLSSFPHADIRNVTVHEAWPGHHLQISVAARDASLATFLCEVPDLTEGWALYCEHIMGVHGYTGRPADRFIRARDALWRAVRIVLDVALHTGRMTASEASVRLETETGMTREEAEAEVLRYTQAPAYNLSYMWGRLQVEALRERLLARGWSERRFHDALLALGSVPVALVARELDGQR